MTKNVYKDLDAAARAYARLSGEAKGQPGGWIYSIPSWEPLCQGWGVYGRKLVLRGKLIRLADGRYEALPPTLDQDARSHTASLSFEDLVDACGSPQYYTPTLRAERRPTNATQAILRLRRALHTRGLRVHPDFGNYQSEKAS